MRRVRPGYGCRDRVASFEVRAPDHTVARRVVDGVHRVAARGPRDPVLPRDVLPDPFAQHFDDIVAALPVQPQLVDGHGIGSRACHRRLLDPDAALCFVVRTFVTGASGLKCGQNEQKQRVAVHAARKLAPRRAVSCVGEFSPAELAPTSRRRSRLSQMSQPRRLRFRRSHQRTGRIDVEWTRIAPFPRQIGKPMPPRHPTGTSRPNDDR